VKTTWLDSGEVLVEGCIPKEVLDELVKVYAFGAEKHQGADNWRAHTDRTYWTAKIERHNLKLRNGRKIDEESGLDHCAHIMMDAACLLYAHLHERDGAPVE
jgi:hypothetical protein